MLWASLVFAHGTPIHVEVNAGGLVVSGGTSDEVGFASQLFADTTADGVMTPAPGNLLVTDLPGFEIIGMSPDSELWIEPIARPVPDSEPPVDRFLWYWNPYTELINVAPSGETLDLLSVRGFGSSTLAQDDTPAPSLMVAEPLSSDLGNHRHLLFYALDNSPSAAVGAYGFFAQLTSPAYDPSDPFLVVMNNGLSAANGFSEMLVATAALAINAAAASTGPLIGDYNGDFVVDGADYTVWRDTLGQSVTPFDGADGDGDGLIDSDDFDRWVDHFGDSDGGAGAGNLAGGTPAVPEPAGVLLAAVGTLLLAIFPDCKQKRRAREIAGGSSGARP